MSSVFSPCKFVFSSSLDVSLDEDEYEEEDASQLLAIASLSTRLDDSINVKGNMSFEVVDVACKSDTGPEGDPTSVVVVVSLEFTC